MKKTIFGVLVTVIGLTFSIITFTYAALHPWNYDGIDGLLGSFLGTHMLVPFIISVIVMMVGLIIVWCEAYRKN